MQMGSSFRRSAGALACAVAALAYGRAAQAQEPRVVSISGGGGTFAFVGTSMPVSDDAVRSMISAHVPEALDAGTEPRAVLLVVDANGEFVTGKLQKVTSVVTGDTLEGLRTFTVGDSAAAGRVSVLLRREGGVVSAASNGAAPAVFVMSRSNDGEGAFGSGYRAEDVAYTAMKRYSAGQIANSTPLMVTVVKLK